MTRGITLASNKNLLFSRLHITPLVVIAGLTYLVCLLFAGASDLGYLVRYIFVPVPIVLMALIGFEKYAWKWSWINPWFSHRPILEGTWVGELQSSWVEPGSNEQIAPTKCAVVIRQTFTSLSLRLFTKESQSFLVAENVLKNDDGTYRIACVYQNEPSIELRGVRSEIHYGAMLLNVSSASLAGHYWTDRKTNGTIQIEFRSKTLATSFDDATQPTGD